MVFRSIRLQTKHPLFYKQINYPFNYVLNSVSLLNRLMPVMVWLLSNLSYLRIVWNFHGHRDRTSENTGGAKLMGVRFLYISFEIKISHILISNFAIDSEILHKVDIDERSISWSFEENLTSLRHLTPLDVILAPVRFTTSQIWRSTNHDFDNHANFS